MDALCALSRVRLCSLCVFGVPYRRCDVWTVPLWWQGTLVSMMDQGLVAGFKEYHTVTDVEFLVKLTPEGVEAVKVSDPEALFKLRRQMSLANMCDPSGGGEAVLGGNVWRRDGHCTCWPATCTLAPVWLLF